MGKTHVRRRQKPQTAAAHASYSSICARARQRDHSDKPHRSIASNPTLCALCLCVVCTVSSATKAKRTFWNDFLGVNHIYHRWQFKHSSTFALPFTFVPQTTVQCHLLPTDFSRAASPSRRQRGETGEEERRQAAIATSYCPLSSSLPRLYQKSPSLARSLSLPLSQSLLPAAAAGGHYWQQSRQ